MGIPFTLPCSLKDFVHVPLLAPEDCYRGNIHRLQSGVSISIGEEAADRLKVGKRSQRYGLLYDETFSSPSFEPSLWPHVAHISCNGPCAQQKYLLESHEGEATVVYVGVSDQVDSR